MNIHKFFLASVGSLPNASNCQIPCLLNYNLHLFFSAKIPLFPLNTYQILPQINTFYSVHLYHSLIRRNLKLLRKFLTVLALMLLFQTALLLQFRNRQLLLLPYMVMAYFSSHNMDFQNFRHFL